MKHTVGIVRATSLLFGVIADGLRKLFKTRRNGMVGDNQHTPKHAAQHGICRYHINGAGQSIRFRVKYTPEELTNVGFLVQAPAYPIAQLLPRTASIKPPSERPLHFETRHKANSHNLALWAALHKAAEFRMRRLGLLPL